MTLDGVHTSLRRGRSLLLQLEVPTVGHLLTDLCEVGRLRHVLRRKLLVSAPLLATRRLVVVDDGVRARRSAKARAKRRV